MFTEFAAPSLLQATIGVLVLLVMWQYYKMQIMAGRVLAIDIFDRSTTRMYVSIVAKGACPHCAAAHGRIYLPSVVAKPGFSPLERPCPNAMPCTAVLVGLYGAWEEARTILEQLRANQKQGCLALSSAELHKLLEGPWERSISADTDRLSMYMLTALAYEDSKQDLAIGHYGYLIQHAKEVRHLPLVVPAYLRVMRLLGQANRWTEVERHLEEFERRFPTMGSGPHFPTVKQRDVLRTVKTQALKSRLMPISA
jgi:hypothetical protein